MLARMFNGYGIGYGICWPELSIGYGIGYCILWPECAIGYGLGYGILWPQFGGSFGPEGTGFQARRGSRL